MIVNVFESGSRGSFPAEAGRSSAVYERPRGQRAAAAVGVPRSSLFVDARKIGPMVKRIHRGLTEEDITGIAGVYRAWRGEEGACNYVDVPGFRKSMTLKEIRKHGHVLTPGRYVDAEAPEDEGEPFEHKMNYLVSQLRERQTEDARLDAAIAANLKRLGFREHRA